MCSLVRTSQEDTQWCSPHPGVRIMHGHTKKNGGEFEQSSSCQTSWRGEEEMQVLFTSH